MRAGRLNRRVTIERKQVVRDATYGSEQITWVTHAEVSAEVRDLAANERVAATAQRVVTRLTRVTVRWVDGLASDMRVRVNSDGRLLQIVGIRELPKRLGYELDCEEYSSA